MGGESGKGTWRSDIYSPCSTSEAGVYLRFLAATGYELSAIEGAVADGVAYTGGQPGNDLLGAGTEPGDGESGSGGSSESDEPPVVTEPVPDGDAAHQDAA
jgi:hypothetical protein